MVPKPWGYLLIVTTPALVVSLSQSVRRGEEGEEWNVSVNVTNVYLIY